jgi:hypothetical protein
MTQIRTSEEVAKEIFEVSMDKDTSILVRPEEVIKAMQEYANQFIDLAAEEAGRLPIEYNKYTCKDVISDTSSILKIKDLIK